MSAYYVTLRCTGGTYGFRIEDGRRTKWAGLRGCRTLEQAKSRAVAEVAELLRRDGEKSWAADGWVQEALAAAADES